MSGLQLSPTLTLSMEMPVHRLAFIGTYNSGKSYASMKLAEQMWAANLQFAAVDPMGIWYGLRLSADGSNIGIPITIFGGQHGDIPIREEDGALVAEVIVREKISAVIDTSHFETEAQKVRFVHRFGERLYHLKKTNPSAIHIFLEEADEFIPQNQVGGDAHMVHIWNTIWKRGGNYGIGGTLITQRPQDINKKALELSAAYFIFNVTGANAFDAVKKTLKNVPEVDQLPTLQQGECLLYSPGWLQRKERLKFLPRETFHARFDPNAAPAEQVERTLAPLAVETLRERFAEAVQESDENDPKKLRARIAELEKSGGQPSEADIAREVALATKPLEERNQFLEGVIRELGGIGERVRVLCRSIHRVGEMESDERSLVIPQDLQIPKPQATPTPEQAEPGALKDKQRQIINAINWWQSIGVTPNGVQVGAVAQIDSTGGYFSNLVGPLVTGGYVVRSKGGFSLTTGGKYIADKLPATPTLAAYHDMLRSRVRSLKSSNAKTLLILDVMIFARGAVRTTEEIGNEIGVDPSGGYFSNSIGPLSTLKLITRSRGVVRPTEFLFPEGLK